MTTQNFGRVVLLKGGVSSEREVSLMSGAGVEAALRGAGVDVTVFDPQTDPLSKLVEGNFDRAFISLHGKQGEDGVIQGLLNYLGIPYTGPGVTASAVAMNKELTKALWRDAGIPVPEGRRLAGNVTDAELEQLIRDFGADGLVVKPAKDGSSIGVTKLQKDDVTLAALRAAVDAAGGEDVLVEAYVHGREFTVAVVAGEALPVIEIIAPEGDYDFQNKYYTDDVRYECPAAIPEDRSAELRALCEKAFAVLGCRGWSRIDVLEKPDGGFVLLEINTSPGMTPHSLVPMAARAVGLDYAALCLKVLGLAATD